MKENKVQQISHKLINIVVFVVNCRIRLFISPFLLITAMNCSLQ